MHKHTRSLARAHAPKRVCGHARAHTFTHARACCVLQIAPKEDELASLQAFQGDRRLLSPPEQFLVMMAEIPRLADKLNLLRNLQHFQVGFRV